MVELMCPCREYQIPELRVDSQNGHLGVVFCTFRQGKGCILKANFLLDGLKQDGLTFNKMEIMSHSCIVLQTIGIIL